MGEKMGWVKLSSYLGWPALCMHSAYRMPLAPGPLPSKGKISHSLVPVLQKPNIHFLCI